MYMWACVLIDRKMDGWTNRGTDREADRFLKDIFRIISYFSSYLLCTLAESPLSLVLSTGNESQD